MEPADLEALLTPLGQRLLEAAEAGYDDNRAIALSTRLRRLDERHSAPLVAAAITQIELRRAAVAKLGAAAATMYFTAEGLQQATHATVAAYRADRARELGCGSLLDLCCGVGSDLLAFARAGFSVRGLDIDPVTARIAAANLVGCAQPGEVGVGDAAEADLGPFDVVFVDPARRRRGGGRVLDPAAFAPPWDVVREILSAPAKGSPALAVAKLSPGFDHSLVPRGAAAEWVSLGGELKELTLWSPAPDAGVRRATVLRENAEPATITGTASLGGGPAEAPVRAVGAYLYEPDPAVIRAHLVGPFADRLGGWLLDPHLAYVSTEAQVDTRFARCYRVLDVLPYQEKRLRAALRERDVGQLTIKKRGVAVSPEELRRRLRLTGSRSATVVLSRTPGSAIALLVEPASA